MNNILNHDMLSKRNLRTTGLLACLMIWVWCSPARAQSATQDQTNSQALNILMDRFVRSVLPEAAPDIASVHEIAAHYEQTLGPDGHWPDLHYQNDDRAFWVGGEHLTRVLLMAESARLHQDAGLPDPQLTARTLRAFDAWIEPDPQNPNWWWNRVGIPELAGEIAALMKPDLSIGEMNNVIKILKRSNMNGATGANLTWAAINQAILGCLEERPAITRAAFDRLWNEVRFANAASNYEGIQFDFSFHQHGPQLKSGSYGLFYANDVGRFIYVAWGTSFQIPADKMKLFDSFMLNGMRWMTRANMLDYNTIGRTITRAGITAAPKDWSLGPISPAGPAYSLGHVTRLLSTLPGPHQREYRNWSDCLVGQGNDHEFIGNKQFWDSDYMVHRRKAFVASVKMFSTRLINAELCNGEGRLSEHLSDGANFLYLTGHEYEDVFPCWDWQKIPGTTAEQVQDMKTMEPHAIGTKGKTRFVGGVSDGTYGLCALDLWRGALRAKKSWFFFDDGYVCLGAGITDSNRLPVVTDVNQELLRGNVFDNDSETPLPKGLHSLPGVHWVYHDHVGYLFPGNEKVMLSNTVRTGRWSDIGQGSSQSVTLPVFNLWIDHGSNCLNATYEYLVFPAVAMDKLKQEAKHPSLKILANQPDLQAAWCDARQLAEIAFWNVGKLQTPIGAIQVDHPCLLLAKVESNGDVQVTVSNPENEPGAVNIRVGDKSVKVVLPQGAAAGSSVSKELKIEFTH